MPPLQSLTVKHFMIAHLLAQGRSNAEIARRLAVSPTLIYNCLDTPDFQIALEDLKAEYASKLSDKIILPFSEMQKRIDEEALGALGRVVGLSEFADKDATRLKANLALLDRSSNTPKQAIANSPDASRELFSVNVVQMVLETACQVGDTTILKAAQRALRQIPPDLPENDFPVVDITSSSNPFAVKSLNQAITDVEAGDEYD